MKQWILAGFVLFNTCVAVHADDFQDRMWKRYQEQQGSTASPSPPPGYAFYQARVLVVNPKERTLLVGANSQQITLIFPPAILPLRKGTRDTVALTALHPGDFLQVKGFTGPHGVMVQEAVLEP